jgi:uncharacterized protein (TIGR03000 family)
MAATAHIADAHRSLFALHRRFLSRHAWQVYGTYVPPVNPLYGYRVMPDSGSTHLVATANFDVIVPAGAEPRFDGTLTSETGMLRYFVVPSLIPANSYAYGVNATWADKGRQVASNRRVAFDRESVSRST